MQTRIAFATVSGARRVDHGELPISYGVSWDVCVHIVLAAAIVLSTALPAARLFGAIGDAVSVIVREMSRRRGGAGAAVRQLNGKVDFQLPLINGCRSDDPAAAVAAPCLIGVVERHA